MDSLRDELRRRAAERARALLARFLVMVATGGCAAPLDLPISPKAPSGAAPVVTVESVAPMLVKAGDTLALAFTADGAVTGCAASLENGTSSSEARCELTPPARCACTLFVDGTVPDGSARVSMRATNALGTGRAERAVQVDTVAPVVEPESVVIRREPVGMNDRVEGLARAASDPGTDYAERKVVEVRLFLPGESTPFTTAPVRPDGSFASVEIPGTEGTSAATRAPAIVLATAVDAAGNETTTPVALTRGADAMGPSADGTRLAFRRYGHDRPDAIHGLPGALADDASAIVSVRIYDAASGGRLVGTQAVASDGSFEELPMGTATTAYAQLWAAGVDKCGQEGPRAPVQTGSASEPPSIDGAGLSFARRPVGETDLLQLRAGGVSSTCAPITAKAWSDGKGSILLGASAVEATGAASIALGTTTRAPARAWVTVQDKCGLETLLPVEALGTGHGLPPAVDGRLVTIERHDIGERDAVRGAAGAIVPSCHVVSATVFSDADGTSIEARVEPLADGSFEAVNVGSPSQAPARVWIAATNKCGLTTERPVEALHGAALAGPVVEPGLMRLARRAVGELDGIQGLAGALTATCALASIELTPEGFSSMTFAANPALRGGFAERPLGTVLAAPAVVRASAIDKCGLSSVSVEVTPVAVPASIEAARLAIVRRDASTTDAVRGEAGAVRSGTCAAMNAEWFDADTGASLGHANVGTGGSIEEGSVGSASSAPRRARVTVSDKCGLTSSMVEALAGAATVGPAIDGARLSYTRRPLGLSDLAFGSAGAIAPGTCAITRLAIVDADESPLTTAALANDGSFTEVAVGSATSSPQQASLVASDKCGLASQAVTFPESDVTAPTVNADRLVLVSATLRLVGQAGAVSDDRANTVRVGLCNGLPCDLAHAVTTFTPAADGSFPEMVVSSSSVRVFAFDKAGNVSASVTPGTSRRTLAINDGPHVAHAAATDVDPRTATPALALAVAAPEADLTALAQTDGTSLVTTAASETSDLALTWTDHTSQGRHDGAMVFAGLAAPMAIWSGAAGGNVEVTEWDGARWNTVPSIGAPSARTGFAFAVDAAGGLGLLFGGDGSGVAAGETWMVDLATKTWTRLTPLISGGAMNLRERCSLTYDERRGRFVLTGSPVNGTSYTMETWTLEPSTSAWRKLIGAGPAARLDHASTYDSRRGLTLVHGGTLVMENPTRPSCELWALDGETWTRLGDDSCLTGPSARTAHTITYDPARDRLVLFGGMARTRIASTYLDGLSSELWVRAEGYWYDLGTQASVPARSSHAAAFDPVRSEVVFSGGLDGSRRALADTWGHDADARHWHARSVSPAARTLAAAAFDLKRSATVVAGGLAYESGTTEPFHWLQDVGVRGTSWAPQIGTGPGGRSGAAAAYDPMMGRVLVVGGARPGVERSVALSTTLAGDVWALGESGFTAVTRGDVIPVRTSAAAAFDPMRGRLVVFGGAGATGVRGDTWEIDPVSGTATEVKLASPSARTLATMAYDPVHGVTVLFGGSADGTTSSLLNDTWTFDGRTWRQVPIRGTWPAPRLGASLAFDTVRGQLVLVGGATPMLANDAWSFDGTSWTPLAITGDRPTPAWGRAMAWDGHRRSMVLFGGTTTPHTSSLVGSTQNGETWSLEGRTPHGRYATHLFGFSLGTNGLRAAGVRFSGDGTNGFELLAWKASEQRWVRLGGHALVTPQTPAAALPGNAADYVTETGRVWLLAMADASSANAASEVVTDAISMWADEAR